MGNTRMITEAEALRGRESCMRVHEQHYVLKNQMDHVPSGHKVAILANGCFWGSEKGMWRLPFGIYSTAVGYCGGFTPNPTYEEVCTGRTGHTEAVKIVYDPQTISFVDLLRWFWQSHDPCAGMGQGNDRGTQYRSAAYYFDDEQRRLVESSKCAYAGALSAVGLKRPITTEIDTAPTFYYAEDYHQQYLAKPGARPYCSAQPQEVDLPPFEGWMPSGLEGHTPRLPESFWAVHAPSPHCVIRSPNAPIALDTFTKPKPPKAEKPAAGSGQAATAPPPAAAPAVTPGVSPATPSQRARPGFFARLFGRSAAGASAGVTTGQARPKGAEEPEPDVEDAAPLPAECPVVGPETLMCAKAHGTSATPVQQDLRWGCDWATADRICNYNRHYAEHSGYFRKTGLEASFHSASQEGKPMYFYDANTGHLLFTAPRGRTHEAFWRESVSHGWPSFRDAEVNWERVRCLANGECVSVDGTHLGHNLPDRANRYCINLVSVAGSPSTA